MLIIEGPDLVGKTTLAQNLLKNHNLQLRGYVYKHFTRLPQGFHRFWGYVDNAVHRSVQDRYHMSELAYCHARGDQHVPLTPEMYRLVEAHLALLGSYTVVLTADEELIRERWREGEMYDIDLVMRANAWYHTQVTRCDVIPFDEHFHFGKHCPHLDAVSEGRLVGNYLERQTTLERMLLDAPPGKTRGLHGLR